MYDIILDPSLDGCAVWVGNSVFTIKGKPKEICEEIHDRVIASSVVDGRKIQLKTIGIDATGIIGRAYLDCLTNLGVTVGVTVNKITPNKIDNVLPILFFRS